MAYAIHLRKSGLVSVYILWRIMSRETGRGWNKDEKRIGLCREYSTTLIEV
jgi:hypothetical protein